MQGHKEIACVHNKEVYIMKHKGLLFIVTAIVVLSSCSSYAANLKLGLAAKANLPVEQLSKAVVNGKNLLLWDVNANSNDVPADIRYYDNIASMLLALEAGEIDEIGEIRPVMEYLIAQNPNLKVSRVFALPAEIGFTFGFMNDEKGKALCSKFNKALHIIKQAGRLDKLTAKYLVRPGRKEPDAVKFASFQGGETIRVAVTGDRPPIDYVAPDGKPAGFNTALLAEVGKRLGCNIEILQVDTASRVAALTSGRADVIFWVEVHKISPDTDGKQPDLTPDIIVSEPYCSYDLFFRIRKK